MKMLKRQVRHFTGSTPAAAALSATSTSAAQ